MLLLFCHTALGQDLENPARKANDSLRVDNSEIIDRQFNDLSEKYSGDEFIYERKVEASGWWTRFKQWLSDFFKDLFNFENRREAEEAVDLGIKIAGVLLFLLVAYFIVKAILNKEGQWVFGKSAEKCALFFRSCSIRHFINNRC